MSGFECKHNIVNWLVRICSSIHTNMRREKLPWKPLMSRWVFPCYLTCHISCDISQICRKPVPFQGRPGGLQHQTGQLWHKTTLCWQRGQKKYVERVLLPCILQSFVLAEHEWTDSDYLGQCHWAHPEFFLSGPSLHEIWTLNASSAMCVQVPRSLPSVLGVSCALLSVSVSSRAKNLPLTP